MATADEVARYLIHLAENDPEPEPMTAMRLQKLLYFCQGWNLAWHGRPLFADQLEAWKNGPVVPQLYEEFKAHGREPLPEQGGPFDLSSQERAAVEQVWSHYRRYSTAGLRDKTHAEGPWQRHYRPDGNARCNAVIPVEELAEHFTEEYRKRTGEAPGDWDDTDEEIPLDQLRQELGC